MSEPECVLSKHEKGFWNADVYLEGWSEYTSCDWYCTGVIDAPVEDIIKKVQLTFPDIKFSVGRVE